jgi:hypothetical protein
MPPIQSHFRCRSVALLLVGIVLTAVAGCGGGEAGGTAIDATDDGFPTNLANYRSPEQWISMIEEAGLKDYADLGRQLTATKKIIFVSPPTLNTSFNAFSWVPQKEVWINSPMLSRYPKATDQAEILLHELIHIKSGETTHSGPWWDAQTEFRQYWSQR